MSDLNGLFEQLAPRHGEYRHHLRWGDDNGSSHVRAALVGPSITIPIVNRALSPRDVATDCPARVRHTIKAAGAGGSDRGGVSRFQTIESAPMHVVVIGAGAFGGWTALELVRRGARVTLIEAWGPGHVRASSGGETRVIRAGYGSRAIYTRMAARALERWREHDARYGRSFYKNTGALWMLGRNDPFGRATCRRITGRAGGDRRRAAARGATAVSADQLLRHPIGPVRTGGGIPARAARVRTHRRSGR